MATQDDHRKERAAMYAEEQCACLRCSKSAEYEGCCPQCHADGKCEFEHPLARTLRSEEEGLD